MEYLVTMTTHVPDGTPERAVADVRAREAARSRELAAAGHLLRLWRPPLQPGEWRSGCSPPRTAANLRRS
jgi:muconolactone D-isomerase